MPEPITPPVPPAPAPAPPAPVPTPPPGGDKRPPWGDDANFNAEKAWELIQNLRTEKGSTPDPAASALKAQVEQMQAAQQAQRDALAVALGVKPDETSDADKLGAQIEAMRTQIIESERRAVAAATNIPESMLTATDAAGMRKQAEELVAFAQAAHYAASAGTPTPTPPAFVPNPGQGQGNTPPTPEAQAAAEYEKYYPSK